MKDIVLTPDQETVRDECIKFIHSETDSVESHLKTIVGSAGSGKTTVIKYVIADANLPQRSIAITAPTHQAKKVIAKATSLPATTIQSLLGLRPDLNLEYFDITKPTFNPLSQESIGSYKLIIIDESSMLNNDLYTLLKEKALEYGVKIIFMGDILQLPPIGEFKSKVFTDVTNQSKLTSVIRQGKDNPNSKLLELLREDVTNNMEIFEKIFLIQLTKHSYIRDEKKREAKAIREALFVPANYSSKGLEYLKDLEQDTLNDKGYLCLSSNEFGKRMLEFFMSTEYEYDRNHIKFMAYTNDSVVQWSKALRNALYKSDSNSQLLVGEPLIGYTTISTEEKTLLYNSEEYVIESITPKISNFNIKVFEVKMTGSEHSTTVNIVDNSDYDNFKDVAFRLLDTAYEKRGVAWRHYSAFKNSHLIMDDFYKGGKKYITKDIYYGYGITIHKSQGSTFTNSAINLTNILSKNFNVSERARLIYVSMSRSKNINLILNK